MVLKLILVAHVPSASQCVCQYVPTYILSERSLSI